MITNISEIIFQISQDFSQKTFDNAIDNAADLNLTPEKIKSDFIIRLRNRIYKDVLGCAYANFLKNRDWEDTGRISINIADKFIDNQKDFVDYFFEYCFKCGLEYLKPELDSIYIEIAIDITNFQQEIEAIECRMAKLHTKEADNVFHQPTTKRIIPQASGQNHTRHAPPDVYPDEYESATGRRGNPLDRQPTPNNQPFPLRIPWLRS